MTGAGVLARALLRGAGIAAPTPPASYAQLARKPPVWNQDAIDDYGWMLISHAIRQADDKVRLAWHEKLVSAVLPAQQPLGARQGSWNPVGVWGTDSGRVGTTAMIALALQAPYRLARVP
jgi:hypothetical protein